ncbi:MAG: hypothetical protein GY793_01745 [Proteobacteria bacterium]|nr:hypothetical protein [Pseudomonadota bacterium]
MNEQLNTFELSRTWFNYGFDNPDKIKPIHSAIYFFAIEHCNRLGWKQKFGFPSQMVMEAIGVKNWRTYSKGLNDLVEFGFINMIEISKNQYSSNIIAIVKNAKAPTKALDKALQKHSTKHSTKHSQSTVSITKQYNKEQITSEHFTHDTFLIWFKQCREHIGLKYNTKRLNTLEKQLFNELKDYTIDEFKHSFKNFVADKYWSNNNLIFPKHFLKEETFTKYLNSEIKEKTFGQKLAGL